MRCWKFILVGGLALTLCAAGFAHAAVGPVSMKPLLEKPARIVVHDFTNVVGVREYGQGVIS